MGCHRRYRTNPLRGSQIGLVLMPFPPVNANAMSEYGQCRSRLFALASDLWRSCERISNGCHRVFDDMRDAQHSWLVEVLAKDLDADG